MSAGLVILVGSAAFAATTIGTDVTTDGVLSTTGNATLGSDAADLLTLNGTIQNTSLVFEGATADGFETTLAVTDPTADRTITVPDAGGNLVIVAGNLAVAASKTLTVSNSLTLAGTDGNTLTFPSGNDTVVTQTASQALTNKTLTSPRIGTAVLDTNGNALLGLTATGSAVNNLSLSNAATAGNPMLTLGGTDANVGLGILLKAAGALNLASSTLNSDSITFMPNTTGGTSNVGTITTEDLNSAKTWTFPNLTGIVALTANNLSGFAATTSAQLAGVISDETGTGVLVLATGPTLAGATVTTSALTLSGLDPDITTGTNEELSLSPNGTGRIKLSKPVRDAVQSGVASDSGNASQGDFGTVNPSTSYLELTCDDVDGCTIALDEAAPVAQGQQLTIVNVGANASTLADVAGVTELSAASFVMGQYDSITLRYTSDRWVETARSNN